MPVTLYFSCILKPPSLESGIPIRDIGLSGSQYSPARRFCISRSEEFLSQMEEFLKINPS